MQSITQRVAMALAFALTVTAWAGSGAAAGFAAEEESPALPAEMGPFEERDQFLFNLLFLSFPARGGEVLLRGQREVYVGLAYANSFVASDVFLEVVSTPSTRFRLTPALIAAAQTASPGESLFFVDTEEARTEIRCRAGLTDRLEAGIEIPFLSYRGGFMDPLIESYHDTLGLGNGGRDSYVQDAVQIALTRGSDTLFFDQSPELYQLGDISLNGRFRLPGGAASATALSVALKLPTGDPERLGGSGGTDAGFEVESTLRHGRHRFHLRAGWVWIGEWSLFPGLHPADTGQIGAAYEFARRPGFSWVGQLQTQSTVFRGIERADPYLARPNTEILIGPRWRGDSGRWFFDSAIIENIFNQDSGVDFGVRVGMGARWGTSGGAAPPRSPGN